MSRRLQLEDIVDLRAYERVREETRRGIIDLKARRRVSVGPVVTLLFENRETVRFQVQEMARAEKIVTDEGVQGELDAYNPLIPEPGQLSATLFIELTDEEALRHWLPRLVGIERSLVLRLAGGEEIRSIPEEAHEEALTRADVTSAVHYLRFELSPAEVDRFAAGPVVLGVDHPDYPEAVTLTGETVAELLRDLRV